MDAPVITSAFAGGILRAMSTEKPKFPRELLRLIADARRTGTTEFALRNWGIEELPLEIGDLTDLRVLKLDKNDLRILAPEIGNLTRLTSLDLSANALMTLPREIGELRD